VLSAAEVLSLCDISPFAARETGSGRPHRKKKQKWDRGWIRLDESNPNGLTLILGYDTMLLTLERVEERCSVSGDSYI